MKLHGSLIGGGLLLAFFVGWIIGGSGTHPGSAPPGSDGGASPTSGPAADSEEEGTVWTCSMHPEIRMPEPGLCPICEMDLIALEVSGAGPGELALSEDARRLAEIETTAVERKFVTVEVPLVGEIDFDETRLRSITAWVPGRIERLFVDYTGIRLAEGDHIAEVYSPDLYEAQGELLEAKRAVDRLETASEFVRMSTESTLEAVRTKLRLLGLTAEQIAAIESHERPTDRLTLHAPFSGTVIERLHEQGDSIRAGEPIVRIADLTHLWLRLEAYESDLAWLRFGQSVRFRTLSLPGRHFHGHIDFIDSVLDPRSRTVMVRVNIENSAGELKPGMLARAVVEATVFSDGRVMERDLSGRWVCPMHPEVVSDTEGVCTVCAMALLPGKQVAPGAPVSGEAPLVIPATAPLITGKRAIVYVRRPGEEPIFKGREVTLGPRAGSHYVVLEGLAEGELVVTSGAFKIDSALQLSGEVSLMNPEGRGATPAAEAAGLDLGGYPLTICVVSGLALGSMGDPIEVEVEGTRVLLCCAGCEAELRENPEPFLEKLRVAGAAKEAKSPRAAPDTCPVSGLELGSMGEPVVVEYLGFEVRLCCDACVAPFRADPEKYLERFRGDAGKPREKSDD